MLQPPRVHRAFASFSQAMQAYTILLTVSSMSSYLLVSVGMHSN